VQPLRGISNDYPELEEVKRWLPNCARNVNNRIPVESAITMIKLNAPRRWPSMRLPNRLRSYQKRKKIEVRHDLEQSERPGDGGLGAGWQILSRARDSKRRALL
jgi:hypothetical protein